MRKNATTLTKHCLPVTVEQCAGDRIDGLSFLLYRNGIYFIHQRKVQPFVLFLNWHTLASHSTALMNIIIARG